MAYLTLDGITVPVMSGADKITVEEIGSRGRAVNGSALSGVRGLRQEWELATPPLPEDDAEALLHLVAGDGVFFPLRGDANSSAGYVPVTASNLRYLTGETLGDADGVGQRAVGDVPFAHHLGGGACQLDIAATNLLSAETAGFGTTIGSAAAIDGATLFWETAVSINAGGALKVTTSAAANAVRGGVNLPTAAVTAGGAGNYVGSVYLRAFSGTPTVRVSITDSGAGASAVVTVTLSTTQWVRVVTPALSIVDGRTAYVTIVEDTADSGVAWYCDKAQLEKLSGPSQWQAGAATRATAGRLQLASATRNPMGTGYTQAWSMNFWVGGGSTALSYLYRVSATNYLSLTAGALAWATPQGGTLAGAISTAAGAWAMTTCVQYATPTGACVSELWVNGAIAATATSVAGVAPFDPGAATSFDIGSDAATSIHAGPLASLLFLPCRLTSRWVLALYNAGSGALMGAWPKHFVGGEIVNSRRGVTALAQVKSYEAVEHMAAGGWKSAGRRLSFSLLEV